MDLDKRWLAKRRLHSKLTVAYAALSGAREYAEQLRDEGTVEDLVGMLMLTQTLREEAMSEQVFVHPGRAAAANRPKLF